MSLHRGALTQAVCLVGGKGTRLGVLAGDTPKPLVRIDGDKRFIDYLLYSLANQGFREAILVAGHLCEVVVREYDGRILDNLSVRVVVEPAPAGTAGALTYVAKDLDSVFLLLNGDSIFDIDYRSLAQALLADDLCALALRDVDDPGRFGSVTHRSGRVTRFVEKSAMQTGRGSISAGVYVMRSTILDLITATPCSIESEVFPVLAERLAIGCRLYEGYFIDIGLPSTLEQARRELPQLEAFNPLIGRH